MIKISAPQKFGRYFEEFKVSDIYQHFPSKTITEAECHLFSLLTMNHHPVHIDNEYAAKTQHKKILVVGTLVFSLVVGQSVRDVSGRAIANLEYTEVKHLKPVFIGDTISSSSEVLSTTPSKTKGDRGIVEVRTVAQNQHGDDVLMFRRKVLVPKSHAPA